MIGDMPIALHGWASAEMMMLTQSNQTYGENRCQTDKAFRMLRATHALTSDVYALRPLEEGARWRYALRNGLPLVELQGASMGFDHILGIGIPDKHDIGLAGPAWRSRFFIKQPARVSLILLDIVIDSTISLDYHARVNISVDPNQTLHLVFHLIKLKLSWLVTGSGGVARPVD
jgi:hypothetical protein